MTTPAMLSEKRATMRRATLLLVPLVAVLGITGCHAGAPAPQATVTVVTRVTETSGDMTESPTPSPSPTESSVELKLGDSLVGSKTIVTALEGKSRDDGFSGRQWSLRAESCRPEAVDGDGGEEVKITFIPWSVRTTDGGVYQAEIGGTLPDILPSYPIDEPIRAGECLNGWMVFPVGDSVVAEVHYRNGLGENAVWKIGQET